MRAIELPSPETIRRRVSPLPLTLAALSALLLVKLVAFAPAGADHVERRAEADPFRAIAPAAARPEPSAGPAAAPTADVSRPAVVPSATAHAAASARGPGRSVADATTRLIDDLLAPSAGGDRLAPADDPFADPLAAEPFLEERRALARQREALGVRQLAVDAAQARLAELVEELSALKAEVDARLAELEAGDEARLTRLVGLYEKMRPKDAARIFDELEFEVLVPLALAMNERKLAPIVAAMDPVVARRLTSEVAAERADASLAAALTEARR